MRTVAIVQVVRERMNNMSVHKVPSQALRLLLLASIRHCSCWLSLLNSLQGFAVCKHTIHWHSMQSLRRCTDSACAVSRRPYKSSIAEDAFYCALWRVLLLCSPRRPMMSWQRARHWWRR